ncbi:hypothetical protein M427DRAFT_47262 [Gonapodya prolifera JEL478]|uniref:Uncharacterized protein n=1 Tax=Gonapodya prolifera (strain JEL478) TaxID=1344416 RepID=A0A139A3Q4_GONPJ|nr:hypothetical protein M427DRAFT_47262 [Gonapodya prolifera JEL478]|eukprot:KXS11258.1 hypothetical protein M427DRAFT_47262 [Gonapodya prolifera JEL478]
MQLEQAWQKAIELAEDIVPVRLKGPLNWQVCIWNISAQQGKCSGIRNLLIGMSYKHRLLNATRFHLEDFTSTLTANTVRVAHDLSKIKQKQHLLYIAKMQGDVLLTEKDCKSILASINTIDATAPHHTWESLNGTYSLTIIFMIGSLVDEAEYSDTFNFLDQPEIIVDGEKQFMAMVSLLVVQLWLKYCTDPNMFVQILLTKASEQEQQYCLYARFLQVKMEGLVLKQAITIFWEQAQIFLRVTLPLNGGLSHSPGGP